MCAAGKVERRQRACGHESQHLRYRSQALASDMGRQQRRLAATGRRHRRRRDGAARRGDLGYAAQDDAATDYVDPATRRSRASVVGIVERWRQKMGRRVRWNVLEATLMALAADFRARFADQKIEIDAFVGLLH